MSTHCQKQPPVSPNDICPRTVLLPMDRFHGINTGYIFCLMSIFYMLILLKFLRFCLYLHTLHFLNCRSLDPVTLNKWHFVRASRTGLLGTMLVDDQPIVSGQLQGSYTQLTLIDSLYLGGHPNYDHTSKHAQASRSFNGCLQKASIHQPLSFKPPKTLFYT